MHWPSFSVPTASFTPAENPLAADSDETPDPGVASDRTRGGKVFGYAVATPFTLWRFGFILSEAEHSDLNDFVLIVKGAEFEFREDINCGSILTPTAVKFAPGSHRITYRRIGSGRYRAAFTLISVPGGS